MSDLIWKCKSNLEITGSFGVEFTIEVPKAKNLTAGVTSQAFQVTDRKSNQSVWMDFTGVGGGTSVGKSLFKSFGVSGGPESLPSTGSYFYGGVLNYGEVEMEELNNKTCLIISGSGAFVGATYGITMIIINPMPLPIPLTWHSVAFVRGLSVSTGTLGGGLMQYLGMLRTSDRKA